MKLEKVSKDTTSENIVVTYPNVFIIDIKNQYGKYTSKEYEFQSKTHMDNWCKKYESYGNKIIGIHLKNNLTDI